MLELKKQKIIGVIIIFIVSIFFWNCENTMLPEQEPESSTSDNTETSDDTNTDNVEDEVPAPIEVHISSITLNRTEIGLLNSGTYSLVPIITPEDCTETEISWTSDVPSIAIVDATGLVTADAANTGTAIITARSDNNSSIYAECSVTVTATPIAVTSVTLNQSTLTLEEGVSATLTAAITPAVATDTTVSWSSGNEDVAVVSGGVVTAISSGNTVITVTTDDGAKTDDCIIEVLVPSYTLSYYSDAADSDPYQLDFAEGDTATVLGNQFGFSISGYTFVGWDTEPDGTGTAYAPGASLPMTGDVALYAQWEANTGIMVSFTAPTDESFDFSEDQDKYVALNGEDMLLVVVQAGYDTYEWYLDGIDLEMESESPSLLLTQSDLESAGIGVHNLTAVVLSSGIPYSKELRFRITYGAVQTWLVTFDSQGGSLVSSRNIEDGELITEPSAPTLAGYNFIGWTTDSEGAAPWVFAADTISSDLTLYAQWEAATCTLTYDANGGINPPASQSAAYDTAVTLSDADSMSRTEAVFVNWNTKPDGSGTAYSPGQSYTMPAEDTVLYAVWDITEYPITLNGNGNTSGPVSITLDFEYDSVFAFPSAEEMEIEKTDCVLTGWNTKPNYSGIHYDTAQTLSVSEAATFYAEWLEMKNISITFIEPADETIDLTGSSASDISLSADDTISIQIEQDFESYQWYGDGQLIAGKTSSALDFTAEEIETIGIGVHTLTAVVENSEGQPYSKELIIRIIY